MADHGEGVKLQMVLSGRGRGAEVRQEKPLGSTTPSYSVSLSNYWVPRSIFLKHTAPQLWAPLHWRSGLAALVVKNPTANAGDVETRAQPLGPEGPLKDSVATHCSILAWRIPWTEEPGELWCIGLPRVQHGRSYSFLAHLQDMGSWVCPLDCGCCTRFPLVGWIHTCEICGSGGPAVLCRVI